MLGQTTDFDAVDVAGVGVTVDNDIRFCHDDFSAGNHFASGDENEGGKAVSVFTWSIRHYGSEASQIAHTKARI